MQAQVHSPVWGFFSVQNLCSDGVEGKEDQMAVGTNVRVFQHPTAHAYLFSVLGKDEH